MCSNDGNMDEGITVREAFMRCNNISWQSFH